MSVSNIYQIQTESDLDYLLRNAENKNKLIVVNFSASWCGPCQKMKPYFIEFSKKYPNVLFLTVNIDDYTDKKYKFKQVLKTIPTYMGFLNEKRVQEFTFEGFDPKKLENNIQNVLKGSANIPVFKAPTLPQQKMPDINFGENKKDAFSAFESSGSFTSFDTAFSSTLLGTQQPAMLQKSSAQYYPVDIHQTEK